MTNGYNTPIGVPIGLPSILSLGLPPLVNPYPTLNLDFIENPQFDSRITFSRGSQATLFDSAGTLRYAKHNLLTYSQPLNTGWVKSGTATVTDNNATAPDGTVAAALVSSPATTDYIYQAPTTVIGQSYIFSVFVKNSTATISRLWVRTSSTAADILLNWSGATLSSVTQTSGTATFTPVGNDWYRVFVTYTAVETAARHRIYGGDGTSTTGNILVWGVQVNATNMEGGVTSSLSTYYPTTTAAYYAPRFDYNPSTLQPRGLLIEEARTNLEPNSEALTSVTGASILNNVATAPSGLVTADKLVEDTSTGSHQVNTISVTWVGNTAYTFTIFLKADTRTQVQIAFGTSSNWVAGQRNAQFDVLNGTVLGTAGANVTASIEAVGNGWYRCRVTCTTTATPVPSTVQTQMYVGGTASYTGNGTSGLFFWGAQVEAGSFPTSYIPTSGTTLTRNADVATMTGTNFSSWYSASEGTLLTQFTNRNPIIDSVPVVLNDNTDNNRIGLDTTSSGFGRLIVTTSGVTQVLAGTAGLVAGAVCKMAGAYKLNDFAISKNGESVSTDTSGTIPTVTQLQIGSRVASLFLNSTIQRIVYYPTRLPNATLVALTA